jgi:hypothetical protein
VVASLEEILEGVADRDVEFLKELISRGDEETRAQVAEIVGDLLTGKRKFPRGQPPKRFQLKGYEESDVAFFVWQAMKRGEPKVDLAVESVARKLNVSKSSVYRCWSSFDPIECEMGFRETVAQMAFSTACANKTANGVRVPSLVTAASQA